MGGYVFGKCYNQEEDAVNIERFRKLLRARKVSYTKATMDRHCLHVVCKTSKQAFKAAYLVKDTVDRLEHVTVTRVPSEKIWVCEAWTTPRKGDPQLLLVEGLQS
jgi:hypothetical protein